LCWPALDGIGRIVIAGCGGVAGGYETIDQRFVLRGEAIIQRCEIVLPLLLGARLGKHGRDEAVVQYAANRKIDWTCTAGLGVTLDFLRKTQ